MFDYGLAGIQGKAPLNVFWLYHQAPTGKENPNFRFESRAFAWSSLLAGIMGVLFGLYLLYDKEWMSKALIVGLPVFVVTEVIVGVIVARKQNERNRHMKKHTVSPNKNDTDGEFSITEVRIGTLKGPILILGVLFVFSALGLLVSVIWEMPKEYFNPVVVVLMAVPWPVLLILDRLLPKRTFSYRGGVFLVEKGSKANTFHRETVRKVDIDHPMLPDKMKFYFVDHQKPVRVPMRGFRENDRFGLPAKILRIVGAEITRTEKQIYDEPKSNAVK